MRLKNFLNIFIICLVLLAIHSIKASTSELEKHSNLGYIYWYGGEDVSYDDGEDSLVSIEDYDTIDMFIEMNMKDIKSNIGVSPKYISKKIPKPLDKNVLSKKPLIAILIDDMGVNSKMSNKVMAEIAKPITFSFLPYGNNIQKQVDKAKDFGHEIMLHLPWEPYSISANPGPNSLKTEDTKEEILENLNKNLNAFSGYDGINNHMGSKFSRYRNGIELVMSEIKERDLFFVDSMTDNKSIAGKIAKEYSVPTTHRNVFLDHIDSDEFVKHALQEVERIAEQEGTVVAIGHPKDATINALRKWLPDLEKRGFKVVTLQKVINERQRIFNAKKASGEKGIMDN